MQKAFLLGGIWVNRVKSPLQLTSELHHNENCCLILFVLDTRSIQIALMQALIFVGIQGSGKSTFYHQRFSNTHLRISLDLAGTRPREKRLLELCLEPRRDFVVDNTNPTPAARAAHVQPALQAGYEVICYFFPPDLPNAIRRNEARTGKSRIPKAGLYTTAKRLVPPSFSEGFHRIYSVTLKTRSRSPRRNLPHHPTPSLTLFLTLNLLFGHPSTFLCP